jgi:hypothetical protein
MSSRFILLGQVIELIWDDILGLKPTGRRLRAGGKADLPPAADIASDCNVIAFGGSPPFTG